MSRSMILAAILAVSLGGAAAAQPVSPIKREFLQRFDVPAGAYETLIGTSELGPNQSAGRQRHFGPEGGYVLAGSGTLLVEAKPPMALKPGDSFKIAPGAVHDLKSGPDGLKVVITWVLQKGKPFTTAVR